MTEQTFVIIKPDAFRRGLTGEIVRRFENKGLKIKAIKAINVDRSTAQEHYKEHKEKPFFDELVEFLISGPVVVMVLEGERAVEVTRRMIGATNPADSPPGTIRGDYAIEISKNVVHGADSLESARREIALYFDESELV